MQIWKVFKFRLSSPTHAANFTRIWRNISRNKQAWQPLKERKECPSNARTHSYCSGGFHILLRKNGAATVIELDDGPMENFVGLPLIPMLRSAAKIYSSRIMTVILTGMGQDGMMGARDIVAAGGRVIAQDEQSSVVWGMPGAVAMNGSCSAVLPSQEIGPWLKIRPCVWDRKR